MPSVVDYKGLSVITPDPSTVYEGATLINSNFQKIAERGPVFVESFGAVGDGTTDDSAAFQSAVDSIESTGGVISLLPSKVYVVKDVIIQGVYPITITSAMGSHEVAGGAVTNNDSASIRPASGATFIFKWDRDTTAFPSVGFSAGGGISGIAFNDIDTGGTNARGRTITTAAIWIKEATNFTMRDCRFEWLKGSAVKVEASIYCHAKNTVFKRCGDTGKPVIDLGGDATNYGYLWTQRIFVENCYSTHIQVRSKGVLYHNEGYHEQLEGTDGPYIDSTGATSNLVSVHGCTFQINTATTIIIDGAHPVGHSITDSTFAVTPGANHVISILADADNTTLSDLTIVSDGSHTGRNINCAALRCVISNIHQIEGGGIKCTQGEHKISDISHIDPSTAVGEYALDLGDPACAYSTINGVMINGVGSAVCNGIEISNCSLTGAYVTRLDGSPVGIHSTNVNDIVDGCRVTEIDTGTAFVFDYPNTVRAGNFADAGDTHKMRVIHRLNIPISDLFEWSAETRLTGATEPSLDTSVDGGRVSWSAGNTDSVGKAGIPLPYGFDGTQDVIVRLKVASASTTDAATFTVHSYWDGGSVISGGATGGLASTTPHVAGVTIASSDIPDAATSLSLLCQPSAHGTDALHLYEIRADLAQLINPGVPF